MGHNRIVQLYEGGTTIVAKGIFGREVCVVGSAKEFGGWNVDRAFPLKWSKGDVWKGEIEMTPGGVAEYKMLTRRIRTGGEIKHEFRRDFKRMVQLYSSGSTVQITGEFKGLVDVRLKGVSYEKKVEKKVEKKEEKKEEKKVEAKKEEKKVEAKKEEKKEEKKEVKAEKKEEKKEEKKDDKKPAGDKFTALAQGIKEEKKEKKDDKKDVKASAIFDFGTAAKEAEKKAEKKKEEKSGDKFTSAVSKWGALKAGADAKDDK